MYKTGSPLHQMSPIRSNYVPSEKLENSDFSMTSNILSVLESTNIERGRDSTLSNPIGKVHEALRFKRTKYTQLTDYESRITSPFSRNSIYGKPFDSPNSSEEDPSKVMTMSYSKVIAPTINYHDEDLISFLNDIQWD